MPRMSEPCGGNWCPGLRWLLAVGSHRQAWNDVELVGGGVSLAAGTPGAWVPPVDAKVAAREGLTQHVLLGMVHCSKQNSTEAKVPKAPSEAEKLDPDLKDQQQTTVLTFFHQHQRKREREREIVVPAHQHCYCDTLDSYLLATCSSVSCFSCFFFLVYVREFTWKFIITPFNLMPKISRVGCGQLAQHFFLCLMFSSSCMVDSCYSYSCATTTSNSC